MEAEQRQEGDGKSPLELSCWLISLSRVEGHPPGLSVPAKEPQTWHGSSALLPCQPAGLRSLRAVSGLALQLEGRGPRLKAGDAAHRSASSAGLQRCAAALRDGPVGAGGGLPGSKGCQPSGEVGQRHVAGEEQTHRLRLGMWKK